MDIIQALRTLEHNHEWVDRYVEFLASTIEPPEGGAERHHILPRALFPEFRRFKEHPWNLIRLSPADHLVAHYYLYRAIPSTRTRFAFRMMVGTRAMSSIEQSFDEAVVQEVARAYAQAKSEITQSPETRAKIGKGSRAWHQGNTDYTHLPHGDSHHNRIFGVSDDTKARISAGLTGKVQSASTIETRRLKLVGQRKPWCLTARTQRSLAMQGICPTNGLTFKGHKHTQAALDKKSAAMKALYTQDPNHPCFTNKPSGTDHWTYGKSRDEATRSKISASLTGKVQSEATKLKRAEKSARAAYDAMSPLQHTVIRQALDAADEPSRLGLRKGLKASDRVYAIITGLNMILKGLATKDNQRYWVTAAWWLHFSNHPTPILPPNFQPMN